MAGIATCGNPTGINFLGSVGSGNDTVGTCACWSYVASTGGSVVGVGNSTVYNWPNGTSY